MADNIKFVRSVYDAWNDRNFDYQVEHTAPDAKIVLVGSGDVLEGPEGMRRYSETWAGAFPDGRATIDHVVAQGDHVVVEFTGRGTHTGTLETSAGAIPATGRSVTLKFCDVLEVKDDVLLEWRTYLDTGSMMAQLGLTAEQGVTSQQ